MSEIIELPRHRIVDKRPIHVEFTPRGFPRQRFALRMTWNSSLGKYIMTIEHVNRNQRVTKGVATPYRFYSYMPWLVFLFADESGEEQEVLPSNLGDEMHFYALPGPNGRPPEEW